MKAKEMIERLQHIVDKHGDLEVSLILEKDSDDLGQVALAEVSVGDLSAKYIAVYGEDAWENK